MTIDILFRRAVATVGGGKVFLGCALAAGLAVGSGGALATGSAQDEAFFTAVTSACNGPNNLPFSTLSSVCSKVFGGGPASGVFPFGQTSSNVGIAGGQGTVSQSSGGQRRRCNGSAVECQEDPKGASADFSFAGFGFLVAAQEGKTNRSETSLEKGFGSDFRGAIIGVDYRFSDRLLAGLTLANNKNDAKFEENAGGLVSKVNSASIYLTYVPLDNAYLGAYLGTGKVRNSGIRRIDVGDPITGVHGIATSGTGGRQDISGVSGGYDWNLARATLGGFLNIDAARTRLDGYTESGVTGLELIMPAQSVKSLTATLGARLSTRMAFDWGTFSPEVRLAGVREYRNDARRFSPALLIDPVTSFAVATDAPDRNYRLAGLGANSEIGAATRLFVDYERRSGHAYISSWALNAGVVIGF